MAMLPQDARRAALSAGLLASDHDGEVVAAARALLGLLAKGGLAPGDVVAAGLVRASTSPTSPAHDIRPHHLHGWKCQARTLLVHPDLLNDRESFFVLSMLERSNPPTQKQQDWLDSLTARLNSRWAA